jgi:hypothetical protein
LNAASAPVQVTSTAYGPPADLFTLSRIGTERSPSTDQKPKLLRNPVLQADAAPVGDSWPISTVLSNPAELAVLPAAVALTRFISKLAEL